MMEQGLLHLYWGDGKGKTTAAMGLALRALGSGKRVVIVQFLKGGQSGEIPLLAQLGAKIFRGKGGQKFVFQMNEAEKAAARAVQNENLTAALAEKRARLIGTLDSETPPMPDDELHAQYRCFDALPIAFTDIEMVLYEDKNAVDWIFRYANPALARLEKTPLHELLGRSFRSVFPNMDSKWLKSYERAALYGETLELIAHSPEIDTYLKIICFPTQPGHCGCLLFDIAEMKFAEDSGDAHNAKLRYFARMLAKLL